MIQILEEQSGGAYEAIEKLEKIQRALLKAVTQIRSTSKYEFPELERALGLLDSAIQKLETE